MKFSHTAVIAFIAVTMLSAAHVPVHAAGTYRLVTVLGNVKIITGKTSKTAVRGQYLTGAQTVVTGKSSMADVSLGGRGMMRIQEQTKVAVASLEKKGAPDLDMEKGGVLVIMSKLGKGDSYQVKTRTQIASVRGTIFQVSGDESRSELNVFTGSVLVNPVTDGAIQTQIAQMVTEGQSLSLDKATVLDILTKKRKISLSAIRAEVKDSFVKQAATLKELPDFKNLNLDTRKELDNRILKLRQELKDKGFESTRDLKDKLLNKKEIQDRLPDKKAIQDKLQERKQGILDTLKNRAR